MSTCAVNIEHSVQDYEIIFISLISAYSLLCALLVINIVRISNNPYQTQLLTRIKNYSLILLLCTLCKAYLGRFFSILLIKLNQRTVSLALASISSPDSYTGLYFSWVCFSSYLELDPNFLISIKQFYAKIVKFVILVLGLCYEIFKIDSNINFIKMNAPDYVIIVIVYSYRLIFVYGLCCLSFCMLKKVIDKMYSDFFAVMLMRQIKRVFFYFSLFYIGISSFEIVILLESCVHRRDSVGLTTIYYSSCEILPIFLFYLTTVRLRSRNHSNSDTISDLFSKDFANLEGIDDATETIKIGNNYY